MHNCWKAGTNSVCPFLYASAHSARAHTMPRTSPPRLLLAALLAIAQSPAPIALLAIAQSPAPIAARAPLVLKASDYRAHFTEGFPGPFINGSGVGVVNASSFAWASENLPLFDASDADLVGAYYYRAKSYKSHLEPTDWVDITHVSSEFGPTVSWGGEYGTINAAAGHHLSEGRWIRDRSYMDELARFWIGSQAGSFGGGTAPGEPFEPGIGHFANGTRGSTGSSAYSSWILTGALKAARVKGDLTLGTDFKGNAVTYKDLLEPMVQWWEARSMQLRVDCIVANHGSSTGKNRTCLDQGYDASTPICYIIGTHVHFLRRALSHPSHTLHTAYCTLLHATPALLRTLGTHFHFLLHTYPPPAHYALHSCCAVHGHIPLTPHALSNAKTSITTLLSEADGWDAMEESVSGNGCRPTINAMMIDEARAIAVVANVRRGA